MMGAREKEAAKKSEVDTFLDRIGLTQHSTTMKKHGVEELGVLNELTEQHLGHTGIHSGRRVKISKTLKPNVKPEVFESGQVSIEKKTRKVTGRSIAPVKVTKPPLKPDVSNPLIIDPVHLHRKQLRTQGKLSQDAKSLCQIASRRHRSHSGRSDSEATNNYLTGW